MAELVVCVEGKTEAVFVRDLISSHLSMYGITTIPRYLGKTRGGIRKWEAVSKDLKNEIRGGKMVTTMFDYYGLPNDWPGRATSTTVPMAERASHIQLAIIEHLKTELGASFQESRFVPYIQLHEFEALLFSQPAVLAQELATRSNSDPASLLKQIEAIMAECKKPELINDSPQTSPSHRLVNLVRNYNKVLFGNAIAAQIPLDTMRQECPHFDSWIRSLEQLGCTSEAEPAQE